MGDRGIWGGGGGGGGGGSTNTPSPLTLQKPERSTKSYEPVDVKKPYFLQQPIRLTSFRSL